MNNLETLVPPLGLCKQIPEGAFADSVFEWNTHGKTDGSAELQVKASDKWRYGFYFPAPTLAEILEALPTRIMGRDNCRFYLRLCDFRLVPQGYWQIGYAHTSPRGFVFAEGQHRHDQTNPATAALRLWLGVNGDVKE